MSDQEASEVTVSTQQNTSSSETSNYRVISVNFESKIIQRLEDENFDLKEENSGYKHMLQHTQNIILEGDDRLRRLYNQNRFYESSISKLIARVDFLEDEVKRIRSSQESNEDSNRIGAENQNNSDRRTG